MKIWNKINKITTNVKAWKIFLCKHVLPSSKSPTAIGIIYSKRKGNSTMFKSCKAVMHSQTEPWPISFEVDSNDNEKAKSWKFKNTKLDTIQNANAFVHPIQSISPVCVAAFFHFIYTGGLPLNFVIVCLVFLVRNKT